MSSRLLLWLAALLFTDVSKKSTALVSKVDDS